VNRFAHTHRSLYLATHDARPPACAGPAEYAGVVRVREVKDRIAIYQCERCDALILMCRGRVIGDGPLPAVVMETAPAAGGA